MEQLKPAFFQQMKLTILLTAKDGDEKSPFGTAYLFAWDREVYPILHEAADWHQPFEDQFDVRKAEMDELLKYLNDCWDAKNPVTFYELEKHFGVQGSASSTTNWSRAKLINGCRYIFLEDGYDAAFWNTLVTNGRCPSEAQILIDPDLGQIYFE